MIALLLPISLSALMACSGADAVSSPTGNGTDTTTVPTTPTTPTPPTPPHDSTPHDTTPTTPPVDTSHPAPPPTSGPATNECASPQSGWLFCDDFETDRTSQYFEYNSANGHFVRSAGTGVNGSESMRAHFDAGQVDAGSLKLAFGKTPSSYIRPVDAGTAKYRELYWRVFIRNDSTWQGGGGDKLSRATSMVTANWAQTMVAPVWSGGSASNRNYLVIDPITGVTGDSTLVSTTYNDWDHLIFMGSRQGTTPLFDASHVGQWHCVEAHARLNDAGQSNGVFELWVDGHAEASRSDLNWLGKYSTYGINAVFFENYWNAGAAKAENRDMDNIVVSTSRIGCGS